MSKNLKDLLTAGFFFLLVYGLGYDEGRYFALCGSALLLWTGYLFGVLHEQQRTKDRQLAEMLARDERREAAMTPEQREAREREYIRNRVIDSLPVDERAVLIVSAPPGDQTRIKVEERVEKEVERILKERKG